MTPTRPAIRAICSRLLPMSDGTPGALLAIGGAEDRAGSRGSVLDRFVRLAGRDLARIAVIPTASSLGPEIIDSYERAFHRLGAKEVVPLRPTSRIEAHDPSLVAELSRVTGVFMTGGNQLRLSAVVAGTPFGEAIREAHLRGAVVGGTSAGASFLSSHMVAMGPGGATPKQRMTQLAAGLGLLPNAVVDQHFLQRNRYGRLLMLVAQSPALLGIGVDENTGAVIEDGHLMSVVGRGSVTVLDGSNVESNAWSAKGSAPLMVSGAVLHVLPAGSRFDLATRSLAGGPATTGTEGRNDR